MHYIGLRELKKDKSFHPKISTRTQRKKEKVLSFSRQKMKISWQKTST
jgi:hypothetical protein